MMAFACCLGFHRLPHLCAVFLSTSPSLSLLRFSMALRKFSFWTVSQVMIFWSKGSGKSLSGKVGDSSKLQRAVWAPRAEPRPGLMQGKPGADSTQACQQGRWQK